VKAGDPLELQVDKAVYRGLGLARHEGRVVFVPGTYGGERVSATVEEVGRGFARARVLRLLEASPHRRASPCRYSERCGGCAYQELEYAEQLRVKQAILRESLQRAHVSWEPEVALLGSTERGWRTRARLHVDWDLGAPRLGFHEEGTQVLVDVLECLQLSPELMRAARALLAALAETGPLGRSVRAIELAESGDGEERVACLVTDLSLVAAPGLVGLGDAAGPDGIAGGAGRGGAARAGAAQRLAVRPCHGLESSLPRASAVLLPGEPVSARAARRHGAGPAAGRRAGAGLVLGVGLFSLPLARRGDAVRAAEIHAQAAADAVANAEAAGLRNVRVFAKDVETALRELPPARGERILLDPPRSGASRLAVRAIAERRPLSITYVSCDPPTFGRDLQLLVGQGYRLAALEALDMFPDTFHVEAVAHLESA
jgi:23S rRNA (uracil1939-C5)-methyltransferase